MPHTPFHDALPPNFPGTFPGLGGGGGGGLSEEEIRILEQINLLADQFVLSPEGVQAILTATQGGILSETQAGRFLLGDDDGGGGGASNALGFAQLAETQRQNAFDRVTDKIRLLSATDDLQESRRENAMFALLDAAPLLVNPGTEFTPGFEPGGVAIQLSNLIGANLEPQRLPTAELPIADFLNAPTTVTPSLIEMQLGAVG